MYSVRFATQVETSSLELAEMLEEDRDKGSNILRSLFSGTLENEK